MLHTCTHVDSVESIVSFLSRNDLARAVAGSKAVLVQLFWNGVGEEDIGAVSSRVMDLVPGAVVVGCSSAGLIEGGGITDGGIAASISCFDTAVLSPFLVDAEPGREEETGHMLADSLAAVPDLKAVLLLASPLDIDAAALIGGMDKLGPSTVLFGTGATREEEGCSGILLGRRLSPRGIAAVGLSGPGLHVEASPLMGWKPLGPAMTLTDIESGRLRGIDGKPALEHYRQILGIEDGEDIRLVEFPLLFERGDLLIARNPISLDSDGSIRIVADSHPGEKARLGYLDTHSVRQELGVALGRVKEFAPQGIFIYSCVCRRFALQEEAEMEMRPFEDLAPSAGSLTLGEFCSIGGMPRLFNFSELIVALREGPPSDSSPCGGHGTVERPLNPGAERHMRLTGHLLNFISTLSEDLGAELAERKRAEEEARTAAREKERLLKELQHRVKNSMALISSMASIEAQTARAPEARDSLMRLEARIAALASLYELLYTTGSIEEIPLRDYLGRVVDFAAKGLGAVERGIEVVRDIESLILDVKRAIPLGLLVNELITDCVKHAFPGREGGRIETRLAREEGLLVLVVRDDGIGLPAGLEPGESQGFGLSLARSLAAQLDASFSARSDGGAVFELRMPL